MTWPVGTPVTKIENVFKKPSEIAHHKTGLKILIWGEEDTRKTGFCLSCPPPVYEIDTELGAPPLFDLPDFKDKDIQWCDATYLNPNTDEPDPFVALQRLETTIGLLKDVKQGTVCIDSGTELSLESNARKGYIFGHELNWLGMDLQLEQAAWLAGLIDGDGCITASISQGNIRLIVAITSKHREIIDQVEQLFHGSEEYRIHGGLSGEKKYWTWKAVGHRKLAELLNVILPYLILKRRQAEIVLELIKRRKDIVRRQPEKRSYDQQDLRLLEQLFLTNSGKVPLWLAKRLES